MVKTRDLAARAAPYEAATLPGNPCTVGLKQRVRTGVAGVQWVCATWERTRAKHVFACHRTKQIFPRVGRKPRHDGIAPAQRGSVVNEGVLSAPGGLIALIAPQVVNRGTIDAPHPVQEACEQLRIGRLGTGFFFGRAR